jgi:16S rRNA (guanine(527)-N(7))-methyltransferase RsmG
MSILASVPESENMGVLAWFEEILNRELNGRVSLSDDQLVRLHEHYTLLERWNEKINLTSVELGTETVIRHYCESLFFAARLENTNRSIADIGSGAGFPGVPIAILYPQLRVNLVESNQRKAVFLREATRGLPNVSVIAQRAEEVSTGFDTLVARAVNSKEVVALMPRLASRIGLMMGETHFLQLQMLKHIAWSEPIRLPWGDRRICVFGECST